MPREPGRVRSPPVSERPRSCLPGGHVLWNGVAIPPLVAPLVGMLGRPVIPTVSHAGRPRGIARWMVVTTMIPRPTAVRPPSVAGLALVPRGSVRGRSRRGGHSDDRMRRRVLHDRRRDADALRPFVRAGRAHSNHKARGNGHQDRARRSNEFRVVAKRVRKMRSDQIRLRGEKRYAHAMGNMQRGPCPEPGDEPPHDGRPDAFGDQGVQESGHRRPGHTSLDATQRAGRRVIADDDEHGIGCQISNVLKRVAQVGLDDDRVRLVHRHGIDQRILRFGGGDDVKPTGSKPSLHVADAARRDHAESVAGRPRAGRSLCRGRRLEDRNVRRLPVECRRRPPLRNP